MFRKTAIRLAFQYSLFILAILAVFSAGLYYWIDNLFDNQYISEVERRLGANDDLAVTDQQHRTVEAAAEVAVQQFRAILLVADGLAAVAIPFASYAIAKRSLRPLLKANESQKRFITNASHELRTPLAVIGAEFELALKKDRDIDYYKSTIVSSKEELQRLNRLTNQLMELQRIENSQYRAPLEMRAFSPTEFLNEIYSSNKKAATAQGFKFAQELSHDVEWVVANKDLIRTAMDNLISNALKHSSPKTTIKIGTFTQGGHVAFFVENIPKVTINERDTKQVFERFWQPKNEHKKDGFGLGLSIVKAVMDVHKSEVEIIQDGNKLRFILTLNNKNVR